MDFSEYQLEAVKTAIYPEQYKLIYPALGLANEAGEVLGKIKKVLRDKNGVFSVDDRMHLAKELGDVLWYIAAICEDIHVDMDSVAMANIEKLKDRQERGVLGGSGDER